MRIVASILLSVVVLAIVWTVVMWGLIYAGRLLYPDNMHNAVSLAGSVAVGPLTGIVAAVITFRRCRKWFVPTAHLGERGKA